MSLLQCLNRKFSLHACCCLHLPQFNASSGQPAPESITDKIFGNTQAVRLLKSPKP